MVSNVANVTILTGIALFKHITFPSQPERHKNRDFEGGSSEPIRYRRNFEETNPYCPLYITGAQDIPNQSRRQASEKDTHTLRLV